MEEKKTSGLIASMKEKKTSAIIFSIISGLVGIAFVNTVLLWRQYTNGVILETWTNILWAANLSLIVQIVGNTVLAFYRPARAYSLIQAVISTVSLLSIIVFFIVFPIDFSQVAVGWLNTLLKVIMIICMPLGLLSIIIHVVRLISGTQYLVEQKK
jgi:hypothetical protein